MKILIMFFILLFNIPILAQEDLWRGFEEFKALMQDQLPSLESAGLNKDDDLEFKVFISTSMPLESIRQYFKDSGRYKAVLVMKGLPENSFMKLQQFVQNLTDKGEGNLILDEEAFTRFDVQTVPTIVLSNKGKVDKIVGNISLAYALEQFVKAGELKTDAQSILNEGRSR